MKKEYEQSLSFVTRLLDYTQLQEAALFPRELFNDRRLLRTMQGLAKGICKTKGYGALAFTQIPGEILQQYNIPDEARNTLYLPYDGMNLEDVLIMNPVIHEEAGENYIPEGCGSIDDGHTYMVVARPQDIEYSAHIFSPGILGGVHKVKKRLIQGFHAGVFQHEVDHLKGRCAYGRRLIDFPDYDKIDFETEERYIPQYGVVFPDALKKLIPKGIDCWVVKRDGAFYRYYPAHDRYELFYPKGYAIGQAA